MTSSSSYPPRLKGVELSEQIRDEWKRVCDEQPQITTPKVVSIVSERLGVTTTRVLQSF